MKKISLILITSFFICISCNNSNSVKEKELELKEKELELKEKELSLKEQENSEIKSDTKVIIKDSELSNIENLIGNWFVPHGAMINMKFNRDGSFIFNDYNTNLNKEETLTGQYKLENGIISLLYDDRPKQNFKFYRGTNGDTNFYIKKGTNYYFVKGENGN